MESSPLLFAFFVVQLKYFLSASAGTAIERANVKIAKILNTINNVDLRVSMFIEL